MIWKVPRIWEGGDVWILGGGPSVPYQFGIPEEVVQQVVKKESPPSIYSPYMSALHDKHVIGINMAYRIGNWIDMVVFGDRTFFLEQIEGLSQFPGLRVCLSSSVKFPSWVKYIKRDTSKTMGISTNPHMAGWSGNTGAAAISIAYHTGAKRVILLGFDMKMGDNQYQHWHDLYNRGPLRSTDIRRMKRLPFNHHLKGFDNIARDAEKLGLTILNACPDSAITHFPKCTVDDILKGRI